MSEHTKGPWNQDQYKHVIDCHGSDIKVNGFALSGSEEAKANTARIIECVNGYDVLLDRIAELESTMKNIASNAFDAGFSISGEGFNDEYGSDDDEGKELYNYQKNEWIKENIGKKCNAD